MIDDPFRKKLPHYVSGLIHFYKRCGLHPNHVTILGFVFGCVAAFFVAGGFTGTALVVWWLSRILDGTDGIYARHMDLQSAFGSFLDILCDMAAYSAMIIGFYFLYPGMGVVWMATLALYVLCITSALALGVLEKDLGIQNRDNRGLRLAAGIAEGGETGIAYSLFILLPEFIFGLGVLWTLVLFSTVLARLALAWRISHSK